MKRSSPLPRFITIFAVISGIWGQAFAAQTTAPEVAVSIAPIHSLIANITKGITSPGLIIGGGQSPHSYSLRPSDALRLGKADAVFWVGPALETRLAKPLTALSTKAHIVQLDRIDGLALLPIRLADPDHGHQFNDLHIRDPHIWLDPQKAIAIVNTALKTLIMTDRGNAERYRANAERTIGRLQILNHEISAQLAPVKQQPFVAYHDSTQYFETAFGLAEGIFVTLSAEQQPGARHVLKIRKTARSQNIRCVFYESGFLPKAVATLARDLGVTPREIDPLGAGFEPGPELYFELMQHIAGTFADCLAPSRTG